MEGWMVFTITGERINPDLITQYLNLTPDKVIRPTESNNYETVWQINSDLSGEESLDKHFDALFNQLLPVREKLKEFAKEARLDFFCTMVKKKGSGKTLQLSPQVLLLIGHIGAYLEVDIEIKG